MAVPRPDDLPEHAVITVPLRCRKCRYDLRGLRARGRCPECGQAVWETIDRVIDPEAAGLPPLRNPRRVALGLTTLFALQLIVMVAALLPNIGPTLESTIDAMRGLGRSSVPLSPVQAPLTSLRTAAILGGVTTIASLLFWPLFRGGGGVGLRAELLTIGAMVWTALAGGWFFHSAVSAEPAPTVDIAFMLALVLASIGVYVGLGRLLTILGRYSRRYRMLDDASRQPTREMVVALCAMWMGLVLRHLGRSASDGTLAFVAGTILIAVAGLLLLIGQAYLVGNSVVIAGSLLQPPLRIEDLIADTPGSSRLDGEGGGGANNECERTT